MTTKLLQKKILTILNIDSSFTEKVSNFIEHSKSFNGILPDLVRESNQKIAGRHLKATFLETGTLSDYDPLLRWRHRESNRLTDLFSTSDSKVALAKFNRLEERFTETPSISRIKNEILIEGVDVKECFMISKRYWGKIESHDFFNEMIARFAQLFSNLNTIDLAFISYYISMDEQGVLFLFQKFFYACLKCKLASQLIVALYKPGALTSFFNKVAKLMWWKLDAIKANIPFFITRNTAVKIIGVSGVSLGLTLFSNIYLKPLAIIPQPLYSGFSGDLGFVFNNVRHYGSMLIFEFTQTISHITNAGIAGFLLPKEEAIRNYIQSITK